MKNKYSLINHLGIVCTLLLFTSANCSRGHRAPPEYEGLKVQVDPTMELFCTIHRLADTGHDTPEELPKYIDDIEDCFGHFRSHRAVKLAKTLWETHRINVSALTTLSVYLGPPPDLTPRNSLDPLPSELDARWTADVVPELIDAARGFSTDAKFMDFYHRQEQLYNRAASDLKECLDDENMLSWFQGYFGYMPNNFSVIIGMQTGWGNYGASITRRDGTREFFSIIGAHSPFFWSEIPRFSSSDLMPIVVHEFCHSFINPLVQNQRELLKEAGEFLYPYHQRALSKGGTLRWDQMMNEYIVRACVIRYFVARNDAKSVSRQIQNDERNGFSCIRALAQSFEEYEMKRDTFPDFNSFLPRIASHFREFAISFRNKPH